MQEQHFVFSVMSAGLWSSLQLLALLRWNRRQRFVMTRTACKWPPRDGEAWKVRRGRAIGGAEAH
eukprot:3463805-Amphidinium_carterae.1